jgi:hypothetical protein
MQTCSFEKMGKRNNYSSGAALRTCSYNSKIIKKKKKKKIKKERIISEDLASAERVRRGLSLT